MTTSQESPANLRRRAGARTAFLLAALLSVEAQIAFGLEVASIPWLGNPDWATDNPPAYFHRTWSGREVVLKAAVRHEGEVSYTWDFGDGSPGQSGQVAAAGERFVPVEARHAYEGERGRIFIARLVASAGGEEKKAEYPVIVLEKALEVEVDAATSDGLWWLFKAAVLDRHDQTDLASWLADPYVVGPTGFAIQAFETNMHKPSGDPVKDPSVDLVRRGLNYLLARAAKEGFSAEEGDTNGNGFGLVCREAPPGDILFPVTYEASIALTAFLASDAPGRIADVGIPEVMGRTYREIIQDMVDSCAFGQNDPAAGFFAGGWRHQSNHFSVEPGMGSDNSATQWPIIALRVAETQRQWAARVPDFVKPRLRGWLERTQNDSGGFGYDSRLLWVNLAKTAGSGISGLAFVCGGDPTEVADCPDLPVVPSSFRRAVDYVRAMWRTPSDNYTDPHRMNFGNIYAMYAVEMAFGGEFLTYRLLGDIDWQAEYERYLVDRQKADGRWESNEFDFGISDELTTAMAILVLTPGAVERPPAAVVKVAADPDSPGEDEANVRPAAFAYFNALGSRPGTYPIVTYEWDFDGDGVFELLTVEPRVRWAFTEEKPDPYVVTLRVCDGRAAATTKQALCDEDRCQVFVRTSGSPPVAVITCPDAATPGEGACVACPGEPVRLCSSASYDIDDPSQGAIVQRCWDLDGDGIYGEVDPAAGLNEGGCGLEECVTHAWDEPGTYVVSLYVVSREEPSRSATVFKAIAVRDELRLRAFMTYRAQPSGCPPIQPDPNFPGNCPPEPEETPIRIALNDTIVLSGLCSRSLGSCGSGGGEDRTIARYDWDLDGDGEYDDSAEAEVCFTGSAPGLVTVGLRVWDAEPPAGVSAVTSRTIEIGECKDPVANLVVEYEQCAAGEGADFCVCTKTPVRLSGAGSDPGTPGLQIREYLWDLDGDGAYSEGSGQTVEVSYDAAGAVEVGLKVIVWCNDDPRLAKSAETRSAIEVRPCAFIRGDANGDGMLTVSDAVMIATFLFGGGRVPPCIRAADVNGDGAPDGACGSLSRDRCPDPGSPDPAVPFCIDISDAFYLLYYLFLSGPLPPAPFPVCGSDPSGSPCLRCDSYRPCG